MIFLLVYFLPLKKKNTCLLHLFVLCCFSNGFEKWMDGIRFLVLNLQSQGSSSEARVSLTALPNWDSSQINCFTMGIRVRRYMELWPRSQNLGSIAKRGAITFFLKIVIASAQDLGLFINWFWRVGSISPRPRYF